MSRKHGADNSLFKIGLRIRQARRERDLTLENIARRAGLSRGLLSKIENFRTLPSVPVLARIARSLNLGLDELVKDIGLENGGRCQLVSVSRRVPLKREKSRGFNYVALMTRSFGNIGFESCVLTLEPGAKRKPVSTDGDEFIFMLRGKVMLRVGNKSFKLSAGDAFYFDGRRPHTPFNTSMSTAELLVIYLLKREYQSSLNGRRKP